MAEHLNLFAKNLRTNKYAYEGQSLRAADRDRILFIAQFSSDIYPAKEQEISIDCFEGLTGLGGTFELNVAVVDMGNQICSPDNTLIDFNKPYFASIGDVRSGSITIIQGQDPNENGLIMFAKNLVTGDVGSITIGDCERFMLISVLSKNNDTVHQVGITYYQDNLLASMNRPITLEDAWVMLWANDPYDSTFYCKSEDGFTSNSVQIKSTATNKECVFDEKKTPWTTIIVVGLAIGLLGGLWVASD